MTKPKPPATAPKSRSLELSSDARRDIVTADLATGASMPAALVVTDFSKSMLGEQSFRAVLDSLTDHASKVTGGDLGRVEAMLCGQAAALNTMFAELARRGALNLGEYIGAADTYLRLALRAQSQCRATLETLAAIKSPPVVFAKQANIAHGPQQVNNTTADIARAEEIQKPPTELLEHDHGQRLDTGAAAATSGGNQAMETMAAIYRPANDRRKVQRKP